ncbi:DegT/DnrJ/EryC1/StrS family aminotransferase [Streptomyces sp. CBMA123]|uniref:DegT/DnrJ/EryC1/StrS family aminotransferase n=1 Tax=Streptomyces sp. CBMA123 TaxID=1896313 RepID=UPI0016618F99|nr:DegT/DnrJ/EryC1/StrS family aminotransferase [Streptomyces sp. CBMA123]
MNHAPSPSPGRKVSCWPRWPEADEDTERAVVRALQSGRLAVSGSKSTWPSQNVAAAATVARMSGRRHCVLVTSGSSAIVTALHALGIGPGDTVAMTATTWVSCATSVLRVGATPMFFDATPESPCGDVATLAETPSAILGIHLYAQHFDVDAARARFPGVPVVEDASHAQFGATADGRRIGSLGDVSILSLQATKIITSGEGGAVLTDDPETAARLESLVMDSRRRTDAVSRTSANELEPAHLLHGANHSPPEFAAALLVDQLARFDRQARRRADGVAILAGALDGSRWSMTADRSAVAGGAFYGVAVRVPAGVGSPAEVIAAVEEQTALILDSVYPPVVEGPLYLPETIKQYAALRAPAVPLPNSRTWHREYVVVPHHAFLADESRLVHLAATLRELDREPAALRPALPRDRPTIEVVMVTRGDRDTLEAALAGVAKQDVDAEVRLTVWVDADRVPAAVADAGCAVVTLGADGMLPNEPFARIAALRELAVAGCTGDFIAFLDDDNEWDPDHLSSLLAVADAGYPAAHSWRTLIDDSGSPATVDRFPWLPPSEAAAELFEQLSAVRVLEPGSPIVRDRAVIPGAGLNGMVDMGAWLLRRDLLRLLTFRRTRSEAEIQARVGEDDILLEQIRRLDIPVGCTETPTLRYRLGGMSTPEYRKPESPVPAATSAAPSTSAASVVTSEVSS